MALPSAAPSRAVFIVDVSSVEDKLCANTILLAAARCLAACYVLNPQLRWGYMFRDGRISSMTLKKRVKALCRCSGIVQRGIPHSSPMHLKNVGSLTRDSLAEFGRLLNSVGNRPCLELLARENFNHAEALSPGHDDDCVKKNMNFEDVLDAINQASSQFLKGDGRKRDHPDLIFLMAPAPLDADSFSAFITTPVLDGVAYGDTRVVKQSLEEILASKRPPEGVPEGHVRTCWLNTGTPQGGPKEGDACNWRLGIWKQDEERYHYGIVKGCEYDDLGTPLHKILYDHGKEEQLNLASCKVDWVQPNAFPVAASARKELKERTEQQRAALAAQGSRFIVQGPRPNVSLQDTQSALHQAINAILRDNFNGGLLRDVERLAGEMSPYQLGTYMRPLLGPCAEECLVLPMADSAAVVSPEDPLFGGSSEDEIALGLAAIVGDETVPTRVEPGAVKKKARHSKSVPGVVKDAGCLVLVAAQEQAAVASQITKGRGDFQQPMDAMPAAEDIQQEPGFTCPTPLGSETALQMALDTMQAAIRARDAFPDMWTQCDALRKKLQLAAEHGQSLIAAAASTLQRLPAPAVLNAALTHGCSSVKGTSAELLVLSQSMSADSSLVQRLLSDILLVHDMKTIPPDSSRQARVALQVILGLELQTLRFEGDQLEDKNRDISASERSFGALLIELTSCATGDPDRWFFKRVLKPRYGESLPEIMEEFGRMVDSTGTESSREERADFNDTNSHQCTAPSELQGDLGQTDSYVGTNQVLTLQNPQSGRPPSAGQNSSAAGGSIGPTGQHPCPSGHQVSGTYSGTGFGGYTSSRDRGNHRHNSHVSRPVRQKRPYLNHGGIEKVITLGERRPSKALQRVQGLEGSSIRRLRSGTLSGPQTAGLPRVGSSSVPPRDTQNQFKDSRRYRASLLATGGTGDWQTKSTKPHSVPLKKAAVVVPDTPGPKLLGGGRSKPPQLTPLARVKAAPHAEAYIPDTGPRPKGADRDKVQLHGSIPLTDTIDDTADSYERLQKHEKTPLDDIPTKPPPTWLLDAVKPGAARKPQEPVHAKDLPRPIRQVKAQPVRGPLNSRLFSPSPIQFGRQTPNKTPAKAAMPQIADTPIPQGQLQLQRSGSVLARKLQLTPLKDITATSQNAKDANTIVQCVQPVGTLGFTLPAAAVDPNNQNGSPTENCPHASGETCAKKFSSKLPSVSFASGSGQHLDKAPPSLSQGNGQEVEAWRSSSAAHLGEGAGWEPDEHPVKTSDLVSPAHQGEPTERSGPSPAIQATPSEWDRPESCGAQGKVKEQQQAKAVSSYSLEVVGGIVHPVIVEEALEEDQNLCLEEPDPAGHHDRKVAVHRNRSAGKAVDLAPEVRRRTRSQSLTQAVTDVIVLTLPETAEDLPMNKSKVAGLAAEESIGFHLQSSQEPQSTTLAVESLQNFQFPTVAADAVALTYPGSSTIKEQSPERVEKCFSAQRATQAPASCVDFDSPSTDLPSPAWVAAMDQAFRQVESLIPLPCACSEEYIQNSAGGTVKSTRFLDSVKPDPASSHTRSLDSDGCMDGLYYNVPVVDEAKFHQSLSQDNNALDNLHAAFGDAATLAARRHSPVGMSNQVIPATGARQETFLELAVSAAPERNQKKTGSGKKHHGQPAKCESALNHVPPRKSMRSLVQEGQTTTHLRKQRWTVDEAVPALQENKKKRKRTNADQQKNAASCLQQESHKTSQAATCKRQNVKCRLMREDVYALRLKTKVNIELGCKKCRFAEDGCFACLEKASKVLREKEEAPQTLIETHSTEADGSFKARQQHGVCTQEDAETLCTTGPPQKKPRMSRSNNKSATTAQGRSGQERIGKLGQHGDGPVPAASTPVSQIPAPKGNAEFSPACFKKLPTLDARACIQESQSASDTAVKFQGCPKEGRPALGSGQELHSAMAASAHASPSQQALSSTAFTFPASRLRTRAAWMIVEEPQAAQNASSTAQSKPDTGVRACNAQASPGDGGKSLQEFTSFIDPALPCAAPACESSQGGSRKRRNLVCPSLAAILDSPVEANLRGVIVTPPALLQKTRSKTVSAKRKRLQQQSPVQGANLHPADASNLRPLSSRVGKKALVTPCVSTRSTSASDAQSEGKSADLVKRSTKFCYKKPDGHLGHYKVSSVRKNTREHIWVSVQTMDVDMATNLNRGIDPQGKEWKELIFAAKKGALEEVLSPGEWCLL